MQIEPANRGARQGGDFYGKTFIFFKKILHGKKFENLFLPRKIKM
jgi:hypothetical protein